VRAGRETALGTHLRIGFHFYMAKTQAQGMREAAGYFEEHLRVGTPGRLAAPCMRGVLWSRLSAFPLYLLTL